jgi:hypothetical protein
MAEGGPLLLAGELNGHRIAILPFRLQESDLPLQIAFPVLMANITAWLNPGRAFDAGDGFLPGDPISLSPGAGTSAIAIRKPDNSVWTTEVGEEAPVFTGADLLGLYEVNLRDAGGERPAGSFAVNLFTQSESAVQPADSIQVGQKIVQSTEQEKVGQRELWPWLVAMAFMVLLVEWWVYYRGARLPRLPSHR